ncbi:hypothetical protein IH799_06105 [candidate division KSB1 bacterium]|nr:hypothetical protein [candidate division KSB1 bacterium]
MAQKASTRHIFLIVISWLLSRLWLSFEISRLAILRATQKPAVIRLTRQQRRLLPSHWIVERNVLYCLSVNDTCDQMIIRETPIEPN